MTEINISLTQFIEFTLKPNSLSRSGYVKTVKKQQKYTPAFDYWRQLRDRIKKMHMHNYEIGYLDLLLSNVSNKKKQNYAEAIKHYKRFIKNKHIEWFDPGKGMWSFNDQLLVRANPELGLIINGKPLLLKIYFKGKKDRIDKAKINSSLVLMKHAEKSRAAELPEKTSCAILNVDKCRLYTDYDSIDLITALQSDAQQFVYLWNH